LTYPKKFKRDVRNIKLSGEGFFEVTHVPAKPFIINAADRANVEVLGTSFNINAVPEGEYVSVQVVEGKVAFYAIGQLDSKKILEKDDQAELQNGIIELNTKTNMNFLSWKTGILHFNQEAIEDVIDLLEKHYNREILLDVSVDKQLKFTSTIDNEELDSVLEELSLVLGISYSYQESTVIISMSRE
jgi:transmembrane sensor